MAAPNGEPPSCLCGREHNDAPIPAKKPCLSADLPGASSSSSLPGISSEQNDFDVSQEANSISCRNGQEKVTGSKKRKMKPVSRVSGSSSNVTVITIEDSSDEETVQNSSDAAASHAQKSSQSTATPVQNIADTVNNQQPSDVADYEALIMKTQNAQKVSDAVSSNQRIPQVKRGSAPKVSPDSANHVQKASHAAANSDLKPHNISTVVIPRRRVMNDTEKQPEAEGSSTQNLPHAVTGFGQMAPVTLASSNQRPLRAVDATAQSSTATVAGISPESIVFAMINQMLQNRTAMPSSSNAGSATEHSSPVRVDRNASDVATTLFRNLCHNAVLQLFQFAMNAAQNQSEAAASSDHKSPTASSNQKPIQAARLLSPMSSNQKSPVNRNPTSYPSPKPSSSNANDPNRSLADPTKAGQNKTPRRRSSPKPPLSNAKGANRGWLSPTKGDKTKKRRRRNPLCFNCSKTTINKHRFSDKNGETNCFDCYCYYKIHGVPRPRELYLKKESVRVAKPKKKVVESQRLTRDSSFANKDMTMAYFKQMLAKPKAIPHQMSPCAASSSDQVSPETVADSSQRSIETPASAIQKPLRAADGTTATVVEISPEATQQHCTATQMASANKENTSPKPFSSNASDDANQSRSISKEMRLVETTPPDQTTANRACARCSTNTTSLWSNQTDGTLLCDQCHFYKPWHRDNRPVKVPNYAIRRDHERKTGNDESSDVSGRLTFVSQPPLVHENLTLSASPKPSSSNANDANRSLSDPTEADQNQNTPRKHGTVSRS